MPAQAPPPQVYTRGTRGIVQTIHEGSSTHSQHRGRRSSRSSTTVRSRPPSRPAEATAGSSSTRERLSTTTATAPTKAETESANRRRSVSALPPPRPDLLPPPSPYRRGSTGPLDRQHEVGSFPTTSFSPLAFAFPQQQEQSFRSYHFPGSDDRDSEHGSDISSALSWGDRRSFSRQQHPLPDFRDNQYQDRPSEAASGAISSSSSSPDRLSPPAFPVSATSSNASPTSIGHPSGRTMTVSSSSTKTSDAPSDKSSESTFQRHVTDARKVLEGTCA
jgi:hypothetical protein